MVSPQLERGGARQHPAVRQNVGAICPATAVVRELHRGGPSVRPPEAQEGSSDRPVDGHADLVRRHELAQLLKEPQVVRCLLVLGADRHGVDEVQLASSEESAPDALERDVGLVVHVGAHLEHDEAGQAAKDLDRGRPVFRPEGVRDAGG